MTIEITHVSTPDEITDVEHLAQEIWSEHYTAIIGTLQVEYMLKTFQNAKAISSQIKNSYQYYLVTADNHPVGYLSLLLDNESKRLMLSKIYVKKSVRKRGVGKAILDFIEQKYKKEGFNTIWLTVNRFNNDAITWYQSHGFITVNEIKKDIGSGFFMDDYIMEKKIENR